MLYFYLFAMIHFVALSFYFFMAYFFFKKNLVKQLISKPYQLSLLNTLIQLLLNSKEQLMEMMDIRFYPSHTVNHKLIFQSDVF